ncbi:hypothetical protein JTE90_017033 [Oedothorax gibbosus]|uniref:Transmembrane protein 177 n=1 Tax=Oedothorax gibbosus TaxID=931172 RepID=A0AAV6ULF1_9ARAC|nr:hypothetical protein JTE90_017033 [Oedothorax gibbosus]
MSRFLSWFATESGKRFTYTCVGIGGISIFGSQVAFNGPLKDRFKKIVQVYDDDKEKPLSSQVQELTRIVVNDSNLSDAEKAKIGFFNVVGDDLFHIGGSNSPWGAMIGLPFYYEDSKSINYRQLKLGGRETIDWVIDGQDLLTALNLSNKAKKFGIMRELYSCDVYHILDNASIATGCFLIPAELSRRINVWRNAFQTSNLKVRAFFYLACYLLGFTMYRCLRDPMRHLSQKQWDQKAASTNREYLEGGIEFYEKTLLKNKALRELLGERGQRQFTRDGNENYFLFAPKLPTKKRLELLKQLREDVSLVSV